MVVSTVNEFAQKALIKVFDKGNNTLFTSYTFINTLNANKIVKG